MVRVRPSGAVCSEGFLKFLNSSRDFSAAYNDIRIWDHTLAAATHLSQVIVFPLALLNEIRQLRG
jgi:hypothetical protein